MKPFFLRLLTVIGAVTAWIFFVWIFCLLVILHPSGLSESTATILFYEMLPLASYASVLLAAWTGLHMVRPFSWWKQILLYTIAFAFCSGASLLTGFMMVHIRDSLTFFALKGAVPVAFKTFAGGWLALLLHYNFRVLRNLWIGKNALFHILAKDESARKR